MDGDTGYYAAAGTHAHSLLIDDDEPVYETYDTPRRLLTIRAANSSGHRSSAQILVNRMYSGRGYSASPVPDPFRPDRITLIASEQEKTIGTITVGFDGPEGLNIEHSFADHAERLRDDGKKLCEFIKFAVDGVARSKKVLASLMHAALICAREVHHCDMVLIEVNPRHVRYYRSMLGFRVLENGRHNHRVNAPAVLMSLDLEHAQEQIIEAHRELPRSISGRRSIYRHAFSLDESSGVAARVQAAAQ